MDVFLPVSQNNQELFSDQLLWHLKMKNPFKMIRSEKIKKLWLKELMNALLQLVFKYQYNQLVNLWDVFIL